MPSARVRGGLSFVSAASVKEFSVARRHLGGSGAVASPAHPVEIERHRLPLFQLLELPVGHHAEVEENVLAGIARRYKADSLFGKYLRDRAYCHVRRLKFVGLLICHTSSTQTLPTIIVGWALLPVFP